MTNKTLTTQPAGMVLVPREPTEEMRRAAHDVFGNPLSKRCYSAMLAAAPAQPDQWKQAIDDELISCHIGTTDSFPDARSALKAVIDARVWNWKTAYAKPGRWICLSCKSSIKGHHGTLDDRKTPCPNIGKD